MAHVMETLIIEGSELCKEAFSSWNSSLFNSSLSFQSGWRKKIKTQFLKKAPQRWKVYMQIVAEIRVSDFAV